MRKFLGNLNRPMQEKLRDKQFFEDVIRKATCVLPSQKTRDRTYTVMAKRLGHFDGKVWTWPAISRSTRGFKNPNECISETACSSIYRVGLNVVAHYLSEPRG